MKLFKLILSTPDAVLFDGNASEITLNTSNGEIGIMADHMPLVSLVSPGVMTIKTEKEEKVLATGGGFVKTSPEKVEIFAQTAKFAESIDEQRAIEAKKQAVSVMTEKKDEISLADATALLERNTARLKVLERKKRHHG